MLNFCLKCKNMFVSKTERADFGETFVPRGICRVFFPPLLVAILDFCAKCKTCLSWKWSELEQFRCNFHQRCKCRLYWRPLSKFLTRRVTAETTGKFSPKLFCPTFGDRLESLRQCKNAFILETEQDRVISMKNLTQSVSAESTGDFSTNCFPTTFGGHLEFLCKLQIHVDLRNSKVERFRPTRYLQGLLQTFCKNCIPPLLAAIWRELERFQRYFRAHGICRLYW